MNRICKWLLTPVFLALLGFFLYVSRHRFIDGDEGLYLLASRLALVHKTPYLDFFYHQAPLLPYVYGMWMKFAGVTWLSARTLSGLLTALLGLMVYAHMCRVTGKFVGGLSAVVLFAASTLVLGWYPVAKTYSLAGLFLFAAYVIVSRVASAGSPWWMACGGSLLALSVDTRSYVAGLIPLFVWWVIQRSEGPRRMANTLWFLGGLAIGLTPSAFLFVLSPDRYLFGNLGYHAMRSRAGLIGDWPSKIQIARVVLVGPDDTGLQFGMISTVCVALIVLWRKGTSASLLAFLIALVLGFISILPTPAFAQYFCLCMPFLIVSAVSLVSGFLSGLHSATVRRTATVILAGLFAGYLVLGAAGFRNYLFTASNVIGIDDPDEAHNWTLARMREVSTAINQLALPGEGIASLWPGYVFESQAAPYPGFENNFGWSVSWRLTPKERTRYQLTSEEDFESGLAKHVPRIVVLGNDIIREDPGGAAYARILESDGYVLARTIGDASIYVCCSQP